MPEGSAPSAGARGVVPVRVGCLPRQADQTTCGIAALAVVAVRAGRAVSYVHAPRVRQDQAQQRLHLEAARTGFPWPRALGTSPWGLARLAGRATGESWGVLPWGAEALRAVRATHARGRDAFLYVGGGRFALPSALVDRLGPAGPTARRLADLVPRHVVAVLGTPWGTAPGAGVDEGVPADSMDVFEPSSGVVTRLPLDVLEGPWPLPAAAFGNWARPLIAVVPRPPASAHH